MVAANPATHKDISISRIPIALLRKLERQAEREQLSISAVARTVLMRHYRMLPTQKNGQ